MTTWRDDPEQVKWIHPISYEASTEEQELAVAAYKRWLTSEIKNLDTWEQDSNGGMFVAVDGDGEYLLGPDVLALIQEDKPE